MVRGWALRAGFVDQPGTRKIHRQPMPLGGGIVIFWVTMLPLMLGGMLALWAKWYGMPDCVPAGIGVHLPGVLLRGRMLAALIGAAALLHGLGIVDDKRHLGPGVKLAVQFLAAGILTVVGEIRFSFFIPSALLAAALSMLWMVVIINAFNFLDNMDGLSAGTAAICGGIILSAAWSSGQVFVSAMLALLIGALVGFLVLNFAPAKIFLGDSGSLLIGMLLAVATIQTTYYHQEQQGTPWFVTLMPLVVLAVPLYDFASVTLLRLRQGKSPFVGDMQHFSHRLLRRGMSQRQAVLTIYLATATCGLGATFLHRLPAAGVALVLVQSALIVTIIAILEQPGKEPAGDTKSNNS